MMAETRHFLTVRWCNKGRRGIFCDKTGAPVAKDDAPLTYEEMMKALDVFWIILVPESRELSPEEVATYRWWRPLAEYSNEYGIAMQEPGS